jgi:DNA-binding NarL/FixJ family response regulator
MFQKVLILDHIEIVRVGIGATLNSMSMKNLHFEKCYKAAYLQLYRALLDNIPFDLLVTELTSNNNEFGNDISLLKKIKTLQPGLKIIVFSIRSKQSYIYGLIDQHVIDAYICKETNRVDDLKEAIKVISEDKIYLSKKTEIPFKSKQLLKLKPIDKIILKMLSNGVTQRKISITLKNEKIHPNSLRLIEKRINLLKDQFNALNSAHLVSIAKDLESLFIN